MIDLFVTFTIAKEKFALSVNVALKKTLQALMSVLFGNGGEE
jgi:hypothetical protein